MLRVGFHSLSQAVANMPSLMHSLSCALAVGWSSTTVPSMSTVARCNPGMHSLTSDAMGMPMKREGRDLALFCALACSHHKSHDTCVHKHEPLYAVCGRASQEIFLPPSDLEDEGDELFDALPVGREGVRVRGLQLPLLVLHLGSQAGTVRRKW